MTDDELRRRTERNIERFAIPRGFDPIHPEGIYACEGCGKTYPEYVNGCIACWDDDLSANENRRKYPRRSVRLVVEEPTDRGSTQP